MNSILSYHSLSAFIGEQGPEGYNCPACEASVDEEVEDCNCWEESEGPDNGCPFCGGIGIIFRCRLCGQVRKTTSET